MSQRTPITLVVVLAAIFLSACGPASRRPAPDLEILNGDRAPTLLKQCSRDTPKAGEATWQPSFTEIAIVEKALPAALKAHHPEMDWSSFPGKWSRRYVGIVRGGRRYIYGDYSPHYIHGDVVARSGSDVCDGGPQFFGAEFDVAGERFSHLAFNGVG